AAARADLPRVRAAARGRPLRQDLRRLQRDRRAGEALPLALRAARGLRDAHAFPARRLGAARRRIPHRAFLPRAPRARSRCDNSAMSFYKHHVFFCLNKRDPPEACCANHGSEAMREYAKKRVKELKLSGPGKVRINAAGCLDRCEEGPCVVVYPEGTWYTYVDHADIDEIIDEHLVKGRVV